MREDLLQWLSTVDDEPWTRYRTLVDLLDRPEDDGEAQAARAAMVAHPRVQSMVAEAGAWPGYALKRHNDANHPLYKFSTLADFGLRAGDPGVDAALNAVMIHRSAEGAFASLIHVPKAFGGPGEDTWGWIACDAPTLLYAVLALGVTRDERVSAAVEHLVSLGHENGWRCAAAPQFGKFKGPGRREHPCPIANVYALKALAQVPELRDAPAARAGAEMLLSHWQERGQQKYFLFGIGADFRKLKYPFVWYDILHVAEVLSHFPVTRADPRFQEMVDAIAAQADEAGRFTAGSMYQAWKGWSFADKKRPSPWLTFLALRVLRRMDHTI
ncbi:MAG: hypothetical protein AUK03_15820 [Anaerolineae bacterium CG2_30_64_16]|nr:MAG: hypothetical protein AUK03_15820 [Anaerolineae bacterium CG2_30_64_16]